MLQASHCSTFRIMCYVPSIAVFCSESIECFPGTASKFFFGFSSYYWYNCTFQAPHSLYLLLLLLLLFTAIELSPGGSGYFTCIQNMKFVTNKFKSGGLHEKHVVATWNLGNHLSICL